MASQISTNTFGVASFVVSSNPTQGNYTTIQAAINAASAGTSIFIRSGTYTENLTLKTGVNLSGLQGSDRIPTVTIVGTATFSASGACSLASVRLQTNGAFCLAVTGSSASVITLISCLINATNNTAISYTSTDATSRVNIVRSAIDIGTTGIAIYSMTSVGTLEFRYCNTTNSGGTSTASSSSAGTVLCLYTNILSPISTSGTGVFNNQYSSIDTSAQNATCLTSTGNGTSTASFSNFSSGTASAVSIGGTSQQNITNANINSSNANALTGAGSGSLLYSMLRFTGTSAGINTPNILANTAVNIIGTTINVSAGAIATTLNIGSGAAAKLVTVGSTNGASSLTERVGTGNYSLDGVAGSTYTIGASTTTGTITIGGTAQTGAITLGSSSGTNIVNVGTGAGATTVNIATGATNAKAVNIATGAVANVVTIGTTSGAASMALKYGTADFTLASATGTVMSALDTGEITYPLQSAFLAFLSSIQSNVTGDSTAYTVVFDTEVYDQNADYNNGTGTFTAPVTGRYCFTSFIHVTGITSAMVGGYLWMASSNSTYYAQQVSFYSMAASGVDTTVSGTIQADMDAADTITSVIRVDNGTKVADIFGTTRGSSYTTFAGYLVC